MLTIDPAPFRPDAVSEETAAFNAELEAKLADLPPTHTVPPEVNRKARDEGRGIFPPGGPLEGSAWREIPVGTGRVRITEPSGAPKGVHLHIHGGGFTLGRPSHYDRQNQERAAAAGCAVISLEYRLAPEHPFPAGPEDCFAAARWALDEKPFGDLPHTIGGESAGAHLSVATLLRLREAGLGGAVQGAALNYGVFDLRGAGAVRRWGDRQLVLSTPTIAFFNANATPDKAMQEDPLNSPVLADLSGLPKALFQIGTADPLVDDTVILASLWAAAGAGAELAVYPGGIHAFDMFPQLQIARDFKAREAAFLSACYG
ncbi:MAG: alpha/beta hydrolase fold domain-containing protein [Pseudomonadota bacterium]